MKTETTYPARGMISADGKFYTHWDGTVHERSVRKPGEACGDHLCSMYDKEGDCPKHFNAEPCSYRLIEGAHVPSADEQAAEAAIRAGIENCQSMAAMRCDGGGDPDSACNLFLGKWCHLRKYLSDVIRDPKAWEVVP